jgi:hypothetical protein
MKTKLEILGNFLTTEDINKLKKIKKEGKVLKVSVEYISWEDEWSDYRNHIADGDIKIDNEELNLEFNNMNSETIEIQRVKDSNKLIEIGRTISIFLNSTFELSQF